MIIMIKTYARDDLAYIHTERMMATINNTQRAIEIETVNTWTDANNPVLEACRHYSRDKQ